MTHIDIACKVLILLLKAWCYYLANRPILLALCSQLLALCSQLFLVALNAESALSVEYEHKISLGRMHTMTGNAGY